MPKQQGPVRKATSNDVAKEANVSQATVSRVFSGKGKVSEETERRVLEAAKKLYYTPNAIAKSLISSKSNLIAVVSIRSDNPFYRMLLLKLCKQLNDCGKSILFFETNLGNNVDDIMYNVMQYQVDGIIAVSASVSPDLVERCYHYRIPVVVFNRVFRRKGIYSLCSDNQGAGRMIADYLADKHYGPFAFVGYGVEDGGTPSGKYGVTEPVNLRLQGFKARLMERGEQPPIVSNGRFSYQSSYEQTVALLEEHPEVRSIFFANDMMALGGTDAIRLHFKLRIPEDIAVIGFDDIAAVSWKSYNLTSVRQPMDEMIEHGVRYLTSERYDSRQNEQFRTFPCKIIERETT